MAMKQSLPVLIPLLCLFFFAIATHAVTTTTAAPATDCSSLIVNLAGCLPFVSNGSTDTKPQGSCCSGLKTVLKTSAQCLCDSFKNIGQYGIALNITKALSLPTSCRIPSPAAGICGLSLGGTSTSPAPSPASTAGALLATNVPTPSPASNKASSTLLGASSGMLIVMLAAAAAALSFF